MSATVRYMGSKRDLAPQVLDIVTGKFNTSGTIADLFSGMGAIAMACSKANRSVVLNDVMMFPAITAKAHCLEGSGLHPRKYLKKIYEAFVAHRKLLRKEFSERLQQELLALKTPEQLKGWLRGAEHFGNSALFKRKAHYSKGLAKCKSKKYRLMTLYFSAGYYSTAQAIDLDSLKFAIECATPSTVRNRLTSILLSTASTAVNSPGHSAQYLTPSNEVSYRRVTAQMSKSIWEIFVGKCNEFEPWGSRDWRAGNKVLQRDALTILPSGLGLDSVDVVYADPPYTRDQYSRFYHVFETLCLYDYPESSGQGRYRGNRYASPFCLISEVQNAFLKLFDGVKKHDIPLILSYPSDGMLNKAGIEVEDFVNSHFKSVDVKRIKKNHSTLGASKGTAKKETTELIFTCT